MSSYIAIETLIYTGNAVGEDKNSLICGKVINTNIIGINNPPSTGKFN